MRTIDLAGIPATYLRESATAFEVREAVMRPRTFDSASNSIEAIVATGTPVSRRDAKGSYQEILDVSGADLAGLRGASVLDAHQQAGVASILGTVDDAWIEGDQIAARIRLSSRPDVQALVDDVRSGVINSVSIGYEVAEWKDGKDASGARTRTAVKWTPRELSFVPVPADPLARTRGLEDRASTNRAIRTLGRQAGVATSVIDDLIDRGATIEDSRMHVLNDIVARGSVAIRSGGRHNETSLDNPEVFQRAAGEALYNRLRPDFKPSAQAMPFVNMTCVDLARECLRRAGQPTQGMAAPTLITRALQTSSDYPLLLANVLDKSLRDAYQVAPGGIRRIARETTAVDFRAKSRIQFDASGFRLTIVPESGEFKMGSMIDSAESYRIDTYGGIFPISRQALVNDNLGAFGDLTRRLGMQAAEFERQFLANLLMSNPKMSDGVAMFDAAHGNIDPVPSVPSEASLSTGRVNMRSQSGPGGGLISVIPRYLLVPPELETEGEKLITSIQATQTSDTNVFAFLDLIVEPRLTSPTTWYLFADPALVESLEYSYLSGEAGPQTSTKVGFEVDGVSVKVRLDYGAGAVEYRSAWMNSGAAA